MADVSRASALHRAASERCGDEAIWQMAGGTGEAARVARDLIISAVLIEAFRHQEASQPEPAQPAPKRDPASTTAATTQVATPANTTGRRRETGPVRAFGFSQEGRA